MPQTLLREGSFEDAKMFIAWTVTIDAQNAESDLRRIQKKRKNEKQTPFSHTLLLMPNYHCCGSKNLFPSKTASKSMSHNLASKRRRKGRCGMQQGRGAATEGRSASSRKYVCSDTQKHRQKERRGLQERGGAATEGRLASFIG